MLAILGVVLSFVTALVFPFVGSAHAAGCAGVFPNTWCDSENGIWYALRDIINILFGLVTLLGVLFLGICGFKLATAGDNLNRMHDARKRLIEIGAGLMMFFCLGIIIQLVLPDVKVTNSNYTSTWGKDAATPQLFRYYVVDADGIDAYALQWLSNHTDVENDFLKYVNDPNGLQLDVSQGDFKGCEDYGDATRLKACNFRFYWKAYLPDDLKDDFCEYVDGTLGKKLGMNNSTSLCGPYIAPTN